MEKQARPHSRIRRHLRLVADEPEASLAQQAWKWILLGVGLGLLVLAAGLVYLKPRLLAPVETVRLQQGTVAVAMETRALMIRRETVHLSPSSGTAVRLVQDGERVRVGTAVAALETSPLSPPAARPAASGPTPGAPAGSASDTAAALAQAKVELSVLAAELFRLAVQLRDAQSREDIAAAEELQVRLDELAVQEERLAQTLSQLERGEPVYVPTPPTAPAPPADRLPVIATAAGVAVFSVDGLEQAAAPAAVPILTPAMVQAFQPAIRPVGEGPVAAGQPLFKIVETSGVWVALVFPREWAGHLTVDSVLEVNLPEFADQRLSLRVRRIAEEGGSVLLVLTPEQVPAELIASRRPLLRLVFEEYTGLVVPVTALDRSGPQPGVWVDEGGRSRFHPVRIAGQNETMAALETDLPEGTAVLTAPPAGRR
jgi:putative membrane fusion protein